MSNLRRRVRPFSVVRQRWFLGAAPVHEAFVLRESEVGMALEELGRFTWMLIAACVVLFVASLPGGMMMLAGVSLGLLVVTSGRVAYMRALRGPQPRLDPELVSRGAARQLMQAELMQEAFGGAVRAQRGRKLEEVELAPVRSWLLMHGEAVEAVLFELADEGYVLGHGSLLCSDLRSNRDLPRRWRFEMLPPTGRILAWTGLGGDAPARALQCDLQSREWIGRQGELSAIDPASLPVGLARGLGKQPGPYRH